MGKIRSQSSQKIRLIRENLLGQNDVGIYLKIMMSIFVFDDEHSENNEIWEPPSWGLIFIVYRSPGNGLQIIEIIARAPPLTDSGIRSLIRPMDPER